MKRKRNADPVDADAQIDVDGTTESGFDRRAKTHRESATLSVIAPTIPRNEVGGGDERIGAVAYPYRVINARVRIERPFLAVREDEYVVSVDRCRQLAIRADVVPSTEHRTIEDVLVLPSELTDDAADEMARNAAFRWMRRRFALWNTPSVDLGQITDVYKLFWLTEMSEKTVLIDSVRGDRQTLTHST